MTNSVVTIELEPEGHNDLNILTRALHQIGLKPTVPLNLKIHRLPSRTFLRGDPHLTTAQALEELSTQVRKVMVENSLTGRCFIYSGYYGECAVEEIASAY